MSGYESNFLAVARSIQQSFAGIARSKLRQATALERIAAAMEEANKRHDDA